MACLHNTAHRVNEVRGGSGRTGARASMGGGWWIEMRQQRQVFGCLGARWAPQDDEEREAWMMYALGTARLSVVVCRWVAAGKARQLTCPHALHQHVPVRRTVCQRPRRPESTPRARQTRAETAFAPQPRTSARSLCCLAVCAPHPARLPTCPPAHLPGRSCSPLLLLHSTTSRTSSTAPQAETSDGQGPARPSTPVWAHLATLTCSMRPTNGSSPWQPKVRLSGRASMTRAASP
jgi:hypothetical protein